MNYLVRFTDALPEGHDFVLIQTADLVAAVYRRDAVTEEVLLDSWAAIRALAGQPAPAPLRSAS